MMAIVKAEIRPNPEQTATPRFGVAKRFRPELPNLNFYETKSEPCDRHKSSLEASPGVEPGCLAGASLIFVSVARLCRIVLREGDIGMKSSRGTSWPASLAAFQVWPNFSTEMPRRGCSHAC